MGGGLRGWGQTESAWADLEKAPVSPRRINTTQAHLPCFTLAVGKQMLGTIHPTIILATAR